MGDKESQSESKTPVLECSVCLQTCIYPVQLKCSHVFCFLCVKGVAVTTGKCPMCRRVIDSTELAEPTLFQRLLDEQQSDDSEHGWFYEGREGWWRYDQRTNADLETAFKAGKSEERLLIAGHIYVIQFTDMVQFRRDQPRKKRRIKRDSLSALNKGVAGIKLPSATPTTSEIVNQLQNVSLDSTD